MDEAKTVSPEVMDCPLEPRGSQLVCRAIEIELFMESGLSVPVDEPTPVFEVIARGPGRKKQDGTYDPPGFEVGDFVLYGVRNQELCWVWSGSGSNFNHFFLVHADAVLAKIAPEAVEEALDRQQRYGGRTEGEGISRPGPQKIVTAGTVPPVDLPPG